MKPELSKKLKLIADHSHPGIRDEVAAHLAACQFSDADDPTLNAIVVQSLIAGQPVRASDAAGALLATEAGLARLGDRFSEIAWGLAKTKLLNVLCACALCILIGASGAMMAIKCSTRIATVLIDVPKEKDGRIRLLESYGGDLRVVDRKEGLVLWVAGAVRPSAGKTESDINYLFIHR